MTWTKYFPCSSRSTKNFFNVSLDNILLPTKYSLFGLKGTLYTHDVLCLIKCEDPNFIIYFRQVICCIPTWTAVFTITCKTGIFWWLISTPNNRKDKSNIFVLLEHTDKRGIKPLTVSCVCVCEVFLWPGLNSQCFFWEYINTGNRLVWTDSMKKVMQWIMQSHSDDSHGGLLTQICTTINTFK